MLPLVVLNDNQNEEEEESSFIHHHYLPEEHNERISTTSTRNQHRSDYTDKQATQRIETILNNMDDWNF